MSSILYTTPSNNLKATFITPAAHSLNSSQRQDMAMHAIEGNMKIVRIAEIYGTSRKFVYQQKNKALTGISQAFEDKQKKDDDVLFYLPITKAWIKQFVLALVLICRAPYHGVVEILRDLFDYTISKAGVHNTIFSTLEKIKQINQKQDLSRVKVGAHDEIYQAGHPVLAGCCTRSTFCYLLSQEESCDANSWGVHLLDLKEKQSLKPDNTIADGGASARKGQQEAWPETPCHGDVFHALKPFSDSISYVSNREIEAAKEVENLTHKIINPRGKWKNEDSQKELLQKLSVAEQVSEKTETLVVELKFMYKCLQSDILSLVGPSYRDRKELLEFIIEELRSREKNYPHRIEPVRRYLENHKDNLLEFVPKMEKRFQEISVELEVPLDHVLEVYQLKGLSSSSQKHWEKHAVLRNRLGKMFYPIESSVEEVLDSTVRASSLIENLNSRLRNYFTLRRHLGNDYLEILRFFLNHRRFLRSTYEERVGKSPAELLTGQKHKHWLEMLGFDLFKQVA